MRKFIEFAVFLTLKAQFDVSGDGLARRFPRVLVVSGKKGRQPMAGATNRNKGEDNHALKLPATRFAGNQ